VSQQVHLSLACMSLAFIALTISTISRGRGQNQRIVLHDKNLIFDLDPLFKITSRAPVLIPVSSFNSCSICDSEQTPI